MNAKNIRLYIKSLSDLSTIPAILTKILSIVRDENASLNEFYEVISIDQALAQRILRAANSVLLGHSGQIKDIEQAVLFLGFDRVKSIAVGMSVMHLFPARFSFTMQNLWVHSYEVAFLSLAISDKVPMTIHGECFLAGLLHDIGRVVLYGMDHTSFLSIQPTDTLLEQEINTFECTHADVGSWFIEEIGLPPEFALTTRYHHQPSAAVDRRDMVSVISLAEALSRKFSPRIEDDGIWMPEHDAILLEFNLRDAEITWIGNQFDQAKPDIKDFFASCK